jgi:hypothetical protein
MIIAPLMVIKGRLVIKTTLAVCADFFVFSQFDV